MFVLLVSVSTRVDVCCTAPASLFLIIIIIILYTYTYYTGSSYIRTFVRTPPPSTCAAQTLYTLRLYRTSHTHTHTTLTNTHAHAHSLSINVTGYRLRCMERVHFFPPASSSLRLLLAPPQKAFRFNRSFRPWSYLGYSSRMKHIRRFSGISLLNSVVGIRSTQYRLRAVTARCRERTEFRFCGNAVKRWCSLYHHNYCAFVIVQHVSLTQIARVAAAANYCDCNSTPDTLSHRGSIKNNVVRPFAGDEIKAWWTNNIRILKIFVRFVELYWF